MFAVSPPRRLSGSGRVKAIRPGASSAVASAAGGAMEAGAAASAASAPMR
ncbi:hypothetical protein ROTAS13_04792 [Roseomonas sp. TAS13]|nr:hypothetical protein ROTAS13_04792 [Roseomonas sp. TAS13]